MDGKKIDQLVKQLDRINSLLRELGVSEGVFDRQVKSFGNGGHIILPKEHLNKKVKVIVG